MQIIVGLGLALAAVALVALAIVGYRRRWHEAARRRPVVAALVALPIVGIAVLVASYFLAPFFTRTELSEPPPAAGGAAASAGAAGRTVAQGEFKGADAAHFGRGTARLIETAPGRYTLRFEEFSVQNGPDLFVYLSNDATGYSEGALEVGRLKATDGSQNYDVPPGTDVSAFRSAVIWCRQFAVQFAAAPLARS